MTDIVADLRKYGEWADRGIFAEGLFMGDSIDLEEFLKNTADEIENLIAFLDSVNAPTHDGHPVYDYEAGSLSLAGRVAALVARMGAVKS